MIAIIMASGSSKRMNRNKLLINLFGKPLIEWTIELTKKCDFEEIIIVYKDKEVKEIAEKLNIKTIYNKRFEYGQSESIKLALSSLKNKCNGYIFFTGDQPFMKKETIEKLMETFSENGGIVLPKVNDKNKSPVIFSSIFKNELMEIDGDVGGRIVIKNNIDKVTPVYFNDSLQFFDIDTEEDLKKAKDIYEGEKL